MKNWFLARLSEKTTWAGLIAAIPSIFVLIGNPMDPAAWTAACGGIASAILPERTQ